MFNEDCKAERLLLKKGDVVDLVMPGSSITEEEYQGCIEFVKGLGLVPNSREYKELVKEEERFCSNTDEYRFEHLYEALSSDKSKAVWCLTGGYGSPRLLELLDKAKVPQHQKLFIGFSDITVLLNYFVQKWGWSCVHGLMPAQVIKGQVSEEAIESIKRLLFEKNYTLSLDVIQLNKVEEEKEVEGVLVGGCLSLIQSLIGTPQALDFKGKVVFLEDDRFETPARLDRAFDHLNRAGCFDEVKAVVLGNFLEGPDLKEKDEAELKIVIRNLIKVLNKKNIPVVQNIKLGHAENMESFPFGVVAKLIPGENPKLNFYLYGWFKTK